MAWSIQAQGDTADEAALWANLKRILTDDRAGATFASFAGQTMTGQYPPTLDEQLADARAQLVDQAAQLDQAAERIASLQGELTIAQSVNQIAAAQEPVT